MGKEIERKYLIKQMPNLKNIKPIRYERYYINDNIDNQIRVQRKDDKFILETKTKISDIEYKKEKQEITEQEFFKLIKDCKKVIIRDSYLINEKPNITIKVYYGIYKGLIRAEVEFNNEYEYSNFEIPEWLGKDITNTELGMDAGLIKLDREDFLEILRRKSMEDNQITIQPEESYKIIRNSVLTAQSKVYTVVNSAMVQAYWEIGQEIHKACGENDRAEYGKKLLQYLSKQLTKEFGKGFTVANLKNMRQFYRTFPIRQTLSSELSWSHYNLLMRIEDNKAREFYAIESAKANWSVRQLKRQIGTFYYERLLASQDKESVEKEIGLPEKVEPKNIIRDPYVLEFLGLEGNTNFYEKDLEQAIIDHLQKFLLELGRGFSFVARQQKITFDGRHFFIDLVFYNYILKCFVIIDLKLGDLTHQDLGQMQMYVNYYTREMMNEGDNPPIGIVLCADKSDQIVKFTLPEDNNQIFASKYKLYLPTEEELKKELNLENYIEKEDNDIDEKK